MLTKRMAARRQLVVAIRLLFDEGDLVAIYSLAANAWEIIDALATRAGVDSVSNQTRQHLPPGKDLKFDYINSPHRNFFKHADKDPDATVPQLREGNVESIAFLAVEDYMRLYKASPVEFQVYQLWYLAKNEEKLSSDAIDRVIALTRKSFPSINDLTRKEQLAMARTVLTLARTDDELLEDPRTESDT